MPSKVSLGEAFARLWTSLWKRRGPIGVKTEHETKGGDRPEARARFWIELREGQREAEEQSSRSR